MITGIRTSVQKVLCTPSPRLRNQERRTIMSSKNDGLSRRDLIKRTGQIAAASALAGVLLPDAYAGGSDTINVALVGCGGRGTGAAANALSAPGSTRLTAMADVFQNKL